MVQFGNLKFSTSIGVMYSLKQKYNHSKLSETYDMLSQSSDVDNIVEILNISYNKANNVNLNVDEFSEVLDNNNIGFIKLGELFTQVVEGIMFNGLSPEEVQERKNQVANLMKR